MPPFFATNNIDSSSSQSSGDSFGDHDPDPPRELKGAGASESRPTGNPLPSSLPANSHGVAQSLLLHALLEGRCMAHSRSADKNTIRRRYRAICESLSQQGLDPSFSSDRFAEARGLVRRGIDQLLGDYDPRINALGTSIVPIGRPQNPLNIDFLTAGLHNLYTSTLGNPATLLSTTRHEYNSLPEVLQSLVTGPTLLHSCKYSAEFDQIRLIGKGGFGKVFEALHKADGARYAVKVIPLNSRQIEKIRKGGHAEVDVILSELRTLARLDHPNIVRYHSGWLEMTSATDASEEAGNRILVWDRPKNDTTSYSDESSDPSERLLHSTSDEFENNTARSLLASKFSRESNNTAVRDIEEEVDEEIERLDDLRLVTRTESCNFTFDHSVRSNSSASLSLAQSQLTPSPRLNLYIQMSLHPFTLADYLSFKMNSTALVRANSISSTNSTSRPHCFHTELSLRILLAILDGVEYLHGEGVVHRDLKPSNIFLSFHSRPHHTMGCVDLSCCKECLPKGMPKCRFMNVRIGDFGLVTALIQGAGPGELPARTYTVGTELYRPSVCRDAGSAKLDVFALGIIAFELLWEFGTRMERSETLAALREGRFPIDFASHICSRNDRIEKCLRGMLCLDETRRLSCKQVRQGIKSILEQ